MKYIIILGDGMADRPVRSLGGRTPLQVAHKPAIDELASRGRSGLLHTVPEGFQPGSEIAHLSLLGYDVPAVFEGRGSLEAASMGIEVEPGEVAMRCNLITIEGGCRGGGECGGGVIKNHSAGHITTEEATELMEFLQRELGSERSGGGEQVCSGERSSNEAGGGSVNFFPGVSYRHLLKIKGGDKHIVTVGPHDVPGMPYRDHLARAEDPSNEAAVATAALVNDLIERSQELLPSHPVNRARVAAGKEPANSIWPWSAGYRPKMQTLLEKYGLRSGAVISAVDLIKGIGVYAGLRPIEVEGATGLYDTNYEGKVAAALEALRENDFVFLHIEASDEAGHEGDTELKIKTIEYLDSRVVKPVMDEIETWDEPVTVALLPDHPTPVELTTHTDDPVPFVIYRTTGRAGTAGAASVPGDGVGSGADLAGGLDSDAGDSVVRYDEESAAGGSYGTIRGDRFMDILINGDQRRESKKE